MEKIPGPVGVDSITSIVRGSRRMEDDTDRMMSSGVFPSVAFQSPTSDMCARDMSPPRIESGRSAVPIHITESRATSPFWEIMVSL